MKTRFHIASVFCIHVSAQHTVEFEFPAGQAPAKAVFISASSSPEPVSLAERACVFPRGWRWPIREGGLAGSRLGVMHFGMDFCQCTGQRVPVGFSRLPTAAETQHAMRLGGFEIHRRQRSDE